MNDQVYTFLLLAATGTALAFVFDCYRVTRNFLRLRRGVTALGDLLYWLIATAVVFLTLLKGNWGEIRFYVFLALFSGAGLYFHFISVYAAAVIRLALKNIGRLLKIIGMVIEFVIIRPIATPVRWLTRLIISGARRLYRRFSPPKDAPPPNQ